MYYWYSFFIMTVTLDSFIFIPPFEKQSYYVIHLGVRLSVNFFVSI